jgi:hypothetical protein
MIAAFGVKAGVAMRAMIITVLVLVDGHLLLTNAAKNSLGVEFIFAPHFSTMSGCFLMAIKAGIVNIATFKLNGNYIKWRMIMCAACFFINQLTFYFCHIENDLNNKKAR